MKYAWLLLIVLFCGCESQLPTDMNTVYDPVTGDTRQEVVSTAYETNKDCPKRSPRLA